jgi:hypothetical protein
MRTKRLRWQARLGHCQAISCASQTVQYLLSKRVHVAIGIALIAKVFLVETRGVETGSPASWSPRKSL